MKENKTPWPTKAVMHQIYEKHLWGGVEFDFYSGWGSHAPELITPYTKSVRDFLLSFKNPISVVDLGCGDFNIGKHLYNYTKSYIGIDIVDNLIDRNSINFKATHLNFLCLDISKDKLPKADCVIIRQVFQHLSNTEIKAILQNLKGYKYLILTEHLPLGDYVPNKDIIAGQGIRLKQHSGVNILKAPFNFEIIAEKNLDTCLLENRKGQLKTVLFTLF